MEKRKRIFALDFIKAILIILVLAGHFVVIIEHRNNDAVMIVAPTIATLLDFAHTISFVLYKLGGVGIFFIVSGAALMYVYKSNLHLLTYYKKRILAIYPIFWIAFALNFLFVLYNQFKINPNIPKINIIYSFLGIDSFLSSYGVPTFYTGIGEWFIAVIDVLYLIFPILLWCVKKRPWLTFAVSYLIHIAVYIITAKHFDFHIRQDAFGCAIDFNPLSIFPLFIGGMIFIDQYLKWQSYIQKSKYKYKLYYNIKKYLLCISLLLYLANFFLRIRGILLFPFAGFILLWYVSRFFENGIFTRGILVISKYSYAIFLVQHVIANFLANHFGPGPYTNLEYNCQLLMFFILCAAFAKLLTLLSNFVIRSVSSAFAFASSKKGASQIGSKNKS